MRSEYKKILLTELDQEQMENHGGYKYVVTADVMSHTAF